VFLGINDVWYAKGLAHSKCSIIIINTEAKNKAGDATGKCLAHQMQKSRSYRNLENNLGRPKLMESASLLPL
jgi:hypothetical protein